MDGPEILPGFPGILGNFPELLHLASILSLVLSPPYKAQVGTREAFQSDKLEGKKIVGL